VSESRGDGRRYDVILTANHSPWSRYSGGGQKSVHMVASEMARQGLRVAVVFSKAPWEKVSPPAGLPYDLHWAAFLAFQPGISSPLRFLNGIPFWFKVSALSSERTVLHGNGDEASLLWAVRRKRKFVYTNRYPEFPGFLRGADWSRPGTWIRILLKEPRFPALALAIRRCDALTATSGSSRAQVMEAFGPECARAETVPNGVDPLALETPFRDGDRRGVLFFGRLTHAKGADLAVEAYALLPEPLRARHPLRLVGQGPLRPDLERRVEALGLETVQFPGWKTGRELEQEIQAAKAVCLPSREESFGNTVAETLALGQALVTSRAGSIPEVAGPWGRQVGEDPVEIAAALGEELARGPDPAARAAQREYVRGRYSWARTAERFREIYGR
jgi:glycosyltransferase involved in cell wall biosynthesis